MNNEKNKTDNETELETSEYLGVTCWKDRANDWRIDWQPNERARVHELRFYRLSEAIAFIEDVVNI